MTMLEVSKHGALDAGKIVTSNINDNTLNLMNNSNRLSADTAHVINERSLNMERALSKQIEESHNQVMHQLTKELPDVLSSQNNSDFNLKFPFASNSTLDSGLHSPGVSMAESLLTVPGENIASNVVASTTGLNVVSPAMQNDITQFLGDMSNYVSAFNGSAPL